MECQAEGMFSTCGQWNARQRECSPPVANGMPGRGNVLHLCGAFESLNIAERGPALKSAPPLSPVLICFVPFHSFLLCFILFCSEFFRVSLVAGAAL
jgi:hypothetical protein